MLKQIYITCTCTMMKIQIFKLIFLEILNMTAYYKCMIQIKVVRFSVLNGLNHKEIRMLTDYCSCYKFNNKSSPLLRREKIAKT